MTENNENTDYEELDKENQKQYPNFNFGRFTDKEVTVIFYDKDGNRWEIRNRMTTPDFVYSCENKKCPTEYAEKPDKCLECGSTDFWLHDIWR